MPEVYPDTSTRENIASFYDSVEMPGGWSFDHIDTLKRINLYYNSKFESGNFDSQGFRKYFYNIVKPACDIATKFIDIDTKNVLIISQKPGDEFKMWVMQKDLYQFMKESKFGNLLNDIAFDLPKYGHVVIKKDKNNNWNIVSLENIRTDLTVSKLEQSSFVYELNNMTPREIKDMKAWDKEAVAQLLQRGGRSYVVYECYDYNLGEGKKWKRTFKADLFAKNKQGSIQRSTEALFNQEDEYLPSIVLYEDEVDELPYRELKWENVPGRWLGFGFVEYLFDNQIRRNEVVNLKSKGLYYTSLRIYTTQDETIGRNILTDVENGDIIKSPTGINPVVNEERNLAAFQSEEQSWDQNSERKTFSFDITRGEEMPSGTPLGVARLSAGMVASYFDIKRENFGLFIKHLILDDILPSFINKTKKEHILTIVSSDKDIDRLRRTIADIAVRRSAVKFMLDTGFYPEPADIERERAKIEAQIQTKKNLFLQIGKDVYENAKYDVDVVVTGEQLDTGVRGQTLQYAFQTIGSNPAILQDPGLRSMFFKLLELGGLNPADLNMMQEEANDTMQPMAPQAPMSPMPQPPQGQPSMMPTSQTT